MTVTVDLPVPQRALAVGAHPDDIEFGCGATLAKWADAGAHVTLCVCTDGAKGTWDRDADIAALVARRETEQRDAGAVLGADDVELLRFVDGELVDDMTARAAVCRVIRRTRPDVVLGHDPWRPYRLHPDHREAGLLTIAPIVAARDGGEAALGGGESDNQYRSRGPGRRRSRPRSQSSGIEEGPGGRTPGPTSVSRRGNRLFPLGRALPHGPPGPPRSRRSFLR